MSEVLKETHPCGVTCATNGRAIIGCSGGKAHPDEKQTAFKGSRGPRNEERVIRYDRWS